MNTIAYNTKSINFSIHISDKILNYFTYSYNVTLNVAVYIK